MNTTQFRQQRLFGIDFDIITMKDAVDWVFRCAAIGHVDRTRYVVTPNVSLTMRHQTCEHFRKVVHHADLTIVDGMPLVTASRWFRKPLPERVAGSDLVFNIFAAAIDEMPLRVFLMGAAPGVADRAAANIESTWPAVNVVGTHSPDFGFENDASANERIVKMINDAEPDVLIIGLGAPKQENWAFNHRNDLKSAVTLCVGGTIDFIAGEQIRAPQWFRENGVEWIWRMCSNPKRLLMRYVRDGAKLPQLLWREVTGRCPAYSPDFETRTNVSRSNANPLTQPLSENVDL